jgi:hypothetical protein
VICGVGESCWESIGIFEFHFGILEYLLECNAFYVVPNSGHDGAREEVTCECGCSGFSESGWFGNLDFLRSWWGQNPASTSNIMYQPMLDG